MILLNCDSFSFVLKIIGYLFRLVQWVVPIVLILFSVLDLFKAFTSGEEKTKKDASAKVVKRIVYAIVIFLVPVLIRIIFNAVGKASPRGYIDNNSPTDFIGCMNKYL